MNYLTIENISKSFGEKILFEKLSFSINKGEKVAFVAKNGTGKSTLLRIVAGLESSDGDTANIIVRKGIKLGYLDQSPEFGAGQTVMEAVFDAETPTVQAFKAYELAMLYPDDQAQMQKALEKMEEMQAWDFEAHAKQILFKLNIQKLDQQVSTLSGGQQKRLALAKVLINEPEFVIMDEPTNHLDLEMIEWLENYLNRQNLTLFMVTHDRYFLERVCDNIIELDRGELYKYKGNYSSFLEKKATRQELLAKEVYRAKSLMRTELEWMRRQPKARGTKAKARVDSFYQLEERANKKVDEDRLQLNIKTTRLGSKILELHNVNKSYGDLKILEKFNYKFKRNEKVGIVGRNGVGKSTLLDLMLQVEKPDGGKVVKGDTVLFGYYSQDGIRLDESKRVIDVVRDVAEYIPIDGKGRNISASMLLERFLFDADHQYTYVHKLSGGEKRRLFLLTILMTNPNFLILDEPTNDLDIVTLNILEEFLLEFKGCLVIVTHDRHFMDKLVDHLFVFEGDGYVRDYPGNYSDYRAWKQIQVEKEQKEAEIRNKAEKQRINALPKEEPKGRRLTYEERKEFRSLEKAIEKLEKKKLEISNKFSDPSLTGEDMEKMSKELGRIGKEIEEKEDRWLELSEWA